MKKATIIDVAKACGVSPKTVSRVINQSPAVTPATRDKVYAAMQETGFQVNLLAKGLKGSRTNIIVVFADRQKEEHLAAWHNVMLKHLFTYGRQRKLKIIFSPSSAERFATDETDGFYLITSGLADGAILLENVNRDSRIAYFEQHQVPYVVFGEADTDDIPSVSMDNFDAGYSGARYLCEKGYDTIAFLIGEKRFRSTQLRIAGFEQAMKNKSSRYHIYSEINTIEKAYLKAVEVLNEDPVRAFFVSGDERAQGVYRAIYEKGLRIPEDVAVLGLDNIPAGRFYFPPISTVGQNFEEMAKRCIDYLDLLVENGWENTEHKKYSYPSELIVRSST